MPKLTERGYELTKKLFDIYYPQNKKVEKDKIETRSRIIGTTDYSKFDKIAVEIEREEILSKKKILNMTNPNDIKIQRQMFEGSSKPRIEMCTIFKNEGDENLINKNYEQAQNSYEKALSNLFYNFDDENEQKKIDNDNNNEKDFFKNLFEKTMEDKNIFYKLWKDKKISLLNIIDNTNF